MRPEPKVLSGPMLPRSTAVVARAVSCWLTLALGKADRSKARAPETCGAEKEVPEAVVYRPNRSVVVIPTPGETRFGKVLGEDCPHVFGPRLLPGSMLSVLSVSPTATTPGLFAGLGLVEAFGP